MFLLSLLFRQHLDGHTPLKIAGTTEHMTDHNLKDPIFRKFLQDYQC